MRPVPLRTIRSKALGAKALFEFFSEVKEPFWCLNRVRQLEKIILNKLIYSII